jgi:hypothetical protein
MSYLEGLSFAQIAGPLPERRVLANGLDGSKLSNVTVLQRSSSV